LTRLDRQAGFVRYQQRSLLQYEVPRLGMRVYEHSHFMDRSGSYRTGRKFAAT
jgi:hypothetical protein